MVKQRIRSVMMTDDLWARIKNGAWKQKLTAAQWLRGVAERELKREERKEHAKTKGS